MQSLKPRIAPDVLASIIEAAPNRVRKRLDRDPTAADAWIWQPTDGGCEVLAGEETVTLAAASDGTVTNVGQVQCTCLLSPKCFHVLACVTSLATDSRQDCGAATAGDDTEAGGGAEVVDGAEAAGDGAFSDVEEDAIVDVAKDPATADVVAAVEAAERTDAKGMGSQQRTAARDADGETQPITSDMRDAADRVRGAVADLLTVGARAAGTLPQSALLRAGHQCRAAGLPMLANTTLRIAEGVRRIRAQSDTADVASLRDDLIVALEATERILCHDRLPAWIVGTNRREFQPTDVNRLDGWFAEPILTRSGYAGLCVYLLSPRGDVYHVTDTRPGESQLVQQAYTGGIDLGTWTVSGRNLTHQSLLVQKATASVDGRLGKGKSTRWVRHGESPFGNGLDRERFARDLSGQIDAVFAAAKRAGEQRRAGWDLIAFDAELMGAEGASIVARLRGSPFPWRLRIANDHPDLAFRENMELLARCPQLRLRAVGRLRLETAGDVELLAIGNAPHDLTFCDATTGAVPTEALTDDRRSPQTQSHEASPDESPTDEASSDRVISNDAASADTTSAGAATAIPQLRLPDTWCNQCNLGLDRLQPHHVSKISRRAVMLDEQTPTGFTDDGLGPLKRRLDAIALGGYRAIAGLESAAHRRDVTALANRNQSTASELVDRLAVAGRSLAESASANGRRSGTDRAAFERTVLAAATYWRAARTEFHRQCWFEYLAPT